MPVEACIPVIPSADLNKTLRFWVEGLGFSTSREMYENSRLIGCMLNKGNMWFWLNRRAGNPVKPPDSNGIRLYWAPSDINEIREHLKNLGFNVSELEDRDYGQTEFFLTDHDGYSHCFGVPTQK
ncbi:MAG TPA: VOC family protein [Terracidiphilus sp.]|nr:VOC family protein [Terracidiphilus sp.]